jgi:hypothetical protein
MKMAEDIFEQIEEYEKELKKNGCPHCDYCAKHEIHSGKGHNYPFDGCWKCETEKGDSNEIYELYFNEPKLETPFEKEMGLSMKALAALNDLSIYHLRNITNRKKIWIKNESKKYLGVYADGFVSGIEFAQQVILDEKHGFDHL